MLQKRNTQDLQNGVEAPIDMEPLLDDRHQHIDRDGDPDLSLHRVLGGAEKRLDAQVLFDPLEEEFDLPSAPVKFRDRERGQHEVVRQEHQPLSGLEIDVGDAPKPLGGTIASGRTTPSQ